MWSTTLIGYCGLQVLDTHKKALLGSSLIFTGLIGSAINGWLVATLFLRAEVMSWTHLLLLNIAVACLGRSLLAGFPFSATSALAGRWLFGDSCCILYAFLHHLFNVAQLCSVAILAAERHHLTQHSHLGECTYISSLLLMWLAAMMWSLLPLLSFGRYFCDIAGIACELDWQAYNMREFSYNLCYMVFGIVITVFVTFVPLIRAVSSPISSFHTSGHEQRYITKSVIALVIGMYLLWLPDAILAAWRFIGTQQPPASLVFMAPISSELAAIVPALAFFLYDRRMRCTLLGIAYDETPIKLSKIARNRRTGSRLYATSLTERQEDGF